VKIPPKKRLPVKRRPLFAHLTNHAPVIPSPEAREKPKKLSPAFLKAQRQRLLDLRDTLVDQMSGVARDAIRGEDGGDSSAFGMHQADAGSDSYDRDFALNILSQEQNALYEIEEALVRIDSGEYGICQGSGEMIPQARLEAIPFARCTVEYQEKLDQEQPVGNFRTPVTSLFGLEEKEVSKPSDDDED
jgi:RNA polymerase-binding transcription factor DksA